MLLLVFKEEENQGTDTKIGMDKEIRSVYWSTAKSCMCVRT